MEMITYQTSHIVSTKAGSKSKSSDHSKKKSRCRTRLRLYKTSIHNRYIKNERSLSRGEGEHCLSPVENAKAGLCFTTSRERLEIS